jgi:hypothetical protein
VYAVYTWHLSSRPCRFVFERHGQKKKGVLLCRAGGASVPQSHQIREQQRLALPPLRTQIAGRLLSDGLKIKFAMDGIRDFETRDEREEWQEPELTDAIYSAATTPTRQLCSRREEVTRSIEQFAQEMVASGQAARCVLFLSLLNFVHRLALQVGCSSRYDDCPNV